MSTTFRTFVVTLVAAVAWFAFIAVGGLATIWMVFPLLLVCLIHVTAMFHLLTGPVPVRAACAALAPTPALAFTWVAAQATDMLGQLAIGLTAMVVVTFAFVATLSALYRWTVTLDEGAVRR